MASFPNTGLISEFTGSFENPLSEGGKWIAAREFGNEPRPPLLRTGGGSVSDSIHGDPNYSAYVVETFDSSKGTVEVWGCSNGGQLGAAVETWRVALFTQLGGVNGYQVYYGGGIAKGFAIWKYTNGDFFPLNAIADTGYPSGVGLRINGGTIEGWGAYGDPYDPAAWSLLLTASDNQHRGKFYLSLGIEDPTGGGLGFGCAGGGVPRRTQFFRWLYN